MRLFLLIFCALFQTAYALEGYIALTNFGKGSMEEGLQEKVIGTKPSRYLTISNPNAEILQNFQVRASIPVTNSEFEGTFAVLDGDQELFYCFEQSNGECSTAPSNYIWVLVPSIPASGSVTLTLKDTRDSRASSGFEVFEAYDDFNGVDFTDRWEQTRGSAGCIYIEDGRLVIDGNQNSAGGGADLRYKSVLSLSGTFRAEGGLIGTDVNEGTAIFLSVLENTYSVNSHSYSNGIEYGWWGWAGNRHSLREYTSSSVFGDVGVFSNTFPAQAEVLYYVGGAYDSAGIAYHYKPSTTFSTEADRTRLFPDFQGSTWKRLFLSAWIYGTWKYDWVRIRKHAAQDPTATEHSGG